MEPGCGGPGEHRTRAGPEQRGDLSLPGCRPLAGHGEDTGQDHPPAATGIPPDGCARQACPSQLGMSDDAVLAREQGDSGDWELGHASTVTLPGLDGGVGGGDLWMARRSTRTCGERAAQARGQESVLAQRLSAA